MIANKVLWHQTGWMSLASFASNQKTALLVYSSFSNSCNCRWYCLFSWLDVTMCAQLSNGIFGRLCYILVTEMLPLRFVDHELGWFYIS